MNRTVGLERTYFIKDFNTLKVIDYLNDIPDDLYNNQEFMNKVRAIQVYDAEILHKKYLFLLENLLDTDPRQAIEELSKLKENAMEEIKNLIEKRSSI